MKASFPREFYIPKGSVKVVSKTCQGVVYIKTNSKGRPQGVAFYGKANKPAWNYSFRDEERRAQYVAQWFTDMTAQEARKTERKATKLAFRHSLKVGDVLRGSWGYDQTNVEFWQVTKLVGEHMVEIRELCCESEDTGWMQGDCVPLPGKYTDKAALRKRVQVGNTIKLFTFGCFLSKAESMTVGGVNVYRPAHWTAYA